MSISNPANCVVLHSDKTYEGKQGLNYAAGISAETAGSTGLCLTVLDLPPGARAKPHLHESHETAIYVISGSGEMLYGEGLKQRATFGPGDYIYIPAGAPHVPINTSTTEHCVAVIARTDPNEQESVVLLPELESAASG
jgi:uncharacterized RmlC-like cupin family protein